jgi:hypothetical protein
MKYPCVATSLIGFVQQVATAYIPHGYWFYSQGMVPEGKDPRTVDAKLVAKYGAGLSKWQRARRKQTGLANVQYIRHGRTFLLMATKGHHAFFEEEAAAIRDVRKTPIKVGGYAISARKGGRDGRLHTHVRVDRVAYAELLARFVDRAGNASNQWFAKEFYNLPFEPYAPVRRQYLLLLRRVNEVRVRSGRARLPVEVLPLRRRIVRPFGPRLEHPESEPKGRGLASRISEGPGLVGIRCDGGDDFRGGLADAIE